MLSVQQGASSPHPLLSPLQSTLFSTFHQTGFSKSPNAIDTVFPHFHPPPKGIQHSSPLSFPKTLFLPERLQYHTNFKVSSTHRLWCLGLLHWVVLSPGMSSPLNSLPYVFSFIHPHDLESSLCLSPTPDLSSERQAHTQQLPSYHLHQALSQTTLI